MNEDVLFWKEGMPWRGWITPVMSGIIYLYRLLRYDISLAKDRKDKNGKKMPYVRMGLSDLETWRLRSAVSLLSDMFGKDVGEYVKDKFEHAMDTGDMRSFKIRIVLLKIRDALQGTNVYRDYVDNLEKTITSAEKEAGCKYYYTGPRRLSLAEQERRNKRLIEQGLTPPVKIDRRKKRSKVAEEKAPVEVAEENAATPSEELNEPEQTSAIQITVKSEAKKTRRRAPRKGSRSVIDMDIDSLADSIIRMENREDEDLDDNYDNSENADRDDEYFSWERRGALSPSFGGYRSSGYDYNADDDW